MADNGQALIPAGQVNPAAMGGGAMARQDFSGSSMTRGAQTQSEALAAQARAAVDARYIMAMRRPRDLDTVRTMLMRECMRPAFADEARYSVQRGKKQDDNGNWVDNFIEGPSIRFAEACQRLMGNIDTSQVTVYDDPLQRQIRISATDLETNATYTRDITVAKTVERRQLRRGQQALGTRTNSYGDTVFIVEASDDDFSNKEQAQASKAMRTLILRLVPGDMIEEGQARCVATLRDRAAKDPDGERKRMCDGYMGMGITPEQLVLYLGHPLAQTTPEEFAHMRSLALALRDRNVVWSDVIEARLAEREADAAPAPGPQPTAPALDGAAAQAAAAVAQAAAELGKSAKPPKGAGGVKAALKAQQPPAPAPQPTTRVTQPPAAAPDPRYQDPALQEPDWMRQPGGGSDDADDDEVIQ